MRSSNVRQFQWKLLSNTLFQQYLSGAVWFFDLFSCEVNNWTLFGDEGLSLNFWSFDTRDIVLLIFSQLIGSLANHLCIKPLNHLSSLFLCFVPNVSTITVTMLYISSFVSIVFMHPLRNLLDSNCEMFNYRQCITWGSWTKKSDLISNSLQRYSVSVTVWLRKTETRLRDKELRWLMEPICWTSSAC